MDINKEFEKLVEEFEKEWHDGHEPQGIDDQYVEEMEDGEEIEEASKSAIQSFGKKLSNYAKKRGGIDKDDFKFIAKEAIGGHLPNPNSLSRMDTEPREVVLNLMAKEFGRKFVEKEYKTRFTNPKDYKEEVEKESRAYLNRKDDDEKEKKRKGLTPMSQKKKRWGSSGYGKGEEVEESEEDEAYGGTKKWKKGQKKMKKAGIELHKKDRFSGYVEDAEIEEGYKALPPHLQKLGKKIEKKQKDWNKQNPDAKIQTLVYNPETGKPDIIVKETMKLEDTIKQVVMDEHKGDKPHKHPHEDEVKKEDSDKDEPGTQGDMKKYQAARAKVMKKFGVKSCSELEGDEKKACYSALDAAHVSDDEEEKGEKKEEIKKTFSKMFTHVKSLMQGK